MKRRAYLAGSGALAALGGCGFRPLYSGPSGAAVDTTEAGIYVAIIPERPGQLLRQALQERLNSGAEGSAQYTLAVGYTLSLEALGFQSDNSSTRTRLTGTATWSLALVAPPSKVVAQGMARSLDGFNSIDGQFFYGDLQTSAAERRLAEAVADQITEQLAIKLRKT